MQGIAAIELTTAVDTAAAITHRTEMGRTGTITAAAAMVEKEDRAVITI